MKQFVKTTMFAAVLCTAAFAFTAPQADARDIVIDCGGSGTNCIIDIGNPDVDGKYKILNIEIKNVA